MGKGNVIYHGVVADSLGREVTVKVKQINRELSVQINGFEVLWNRDTKSGGEALFGDLALLGEILRGPAARAVSSHVHEEG